MDQQKCNPSKVTVIAIVLLAKILCTCTCTNVLFKMTDYTLQYHTIIHNGMGITADT